jgi:hypothetical protein
MCQFILAFIAIERKEMQCHGSYVTKRKKRWLFMGLEPYIPSTIWADVLGQLDYKKNI